MMKTKTLFLAIISIIIFGGSTCTKDTEDSFCNLSRPVYKTITNEEGHISYSDKYKRYKISFLDKSGNIDSQIIGMVCDLDKDYKVIGLKVIVTGTLKSFNDTENITPELGGESIYFLEIAKITLK